MGWEDPNYDAIRDLIDTRRRAKEQYKTVMLHYPRQVGKTTMQDKMMEEVNEAEELSKKEKPSDFVTEDDTLHHAKIQILTGLQNKPMYQGTVDKETVRRRRAKNKAARVSRRKNRK